jgi:hypothetical protein
MKIQGEEPWEDGGSIWHLFRRKGKKGNGGSRAGANKLKWYLIRENRRKGNGGAEQELTK